MMTVWRDFMAGNRYWELEPFFGVDGARGLALDGVEYIIYVEKPGPIEVTLEHHGYDVAWINPANGERVKQKNYSGERFTGEPPDRSHDWVLHISRESEKARMKSFKFDSARGSGAGDHPGGREAGVRYSGAGRERVSMAHPLHFALKIRKDTRATRYLWVEWTAEVAADGEGYRVIERARRGR